MKGQTLVSQAANDCRVDWRHPTTGFIAKYSSQKLNALNFIFVQKSSGKSCHFLFALWRRNAIQHCKWAMKWDKFIFDIIFFLYFIFLWVGVGVFVVVVVVVVVVTGICIGMDSGKQLFYSSLAVVQYFSMLTIVVDITIITVIIWIFYYV